MQVFNSRNEFYKSPFGAVLQASEVLFRICLEQSNVTPFLSICREGEKPEKLAMAFMGSEEGENIFAVSFYPDFCGLYFYNFDLGHDNLGVYNALKGNGVIAGEGELFQLTVYQKTFSVPKQVKGKIFYQIFPDRFYESHPRQALSFSDRIYRTDKDGEPYYYPTEQIDGWINKDYYGGDLQGIIEKLPYLCELGVGYIYLNPIFEAHSNHRYNTADYMKIDPDLGTLQDFQALCHAAHSRGISVVLDGVFSHTGSDSVYFNKEGRYGDGGAYRDPKSPYRKWYDFDKKYPCGYRAWWGFNTLPEVDEYNSSYINYICGKDGVIDFWLSQGADGFRLDVADELPDEFICEIRNAVKKHGEDKLLLGEVWEDASNKVSFGKRRKYLLGEELDTTMNYPFRTAILEFLREGDGYALCESVITICENYPKCALDIALNSLSTHDTPRAMTALCGYEPYGTDRNRQSGKFLSVEEYERARRLIVCGFALLYGVPGVPCIYYGDEIGMQGYRDPFNRGYFKWWAVDCYIQDNVKSLGAFRNSHDIFADGKIYFIYASYNCVAFTRYCEGCEKEVIIGVNRGETEESFEYKGRLYTLNPMDYFMLEV
ncbi:MAG: glycoside hydrolase family 13 protein [Oscillospiraceae bacterium]